jgi:hypothetical protein
MASLPSMAAYAPRISNHYLEGWRVGWLMAPAGRQAGSWSGADGFTVKLEAKHHPSSPGLDVLPSFLLLKCCNRKKGLCHLSTRGRSNRQGET